MTNGARFGAALLCALALAGSALAAGLADGGSPVTRRDLEDTYIPAVTDQAVHSAKTAMDQIYSQAYDMADMLGDKYLHLMGAGSAGGYSDRCVRRVFAVNETITLDTGAGILLEEGIVRVSHAGAVVNVTTGELLDTGRTLAAGCRYLVAEDTSAVFTVESDRAVLAVEGEFLVR